MPDDAPLSPEEIEALMQGGGDAGHAPVVAPPAAPASSSPADAPMTGPQIDALMGNSPPPAAGTGGMIGAVPANPNGGDSGGGFLDTAWHNVKSFMTGGNDAVEHPELGPLNVGGLGLGPTDAGLWQILGGMATTRDPQAMMDIIKRAAPDATFSRDKFGNPIVQRGDGPAMYVQRPGLTPDAAAYYLTQSLPAMVGGGLAKLPFLLRAGAAGALGGGQSVASDLAAMGLGSQQGVSLQRALDTAAATTGLTAAAGVVAPVVGKLASVIGAGWQKLAGGAGKLLSDTAANLPDTAPFDPATMLTRTGQSVFGYAQRDPEAAARLQGLTVGQVRSMQDMLGQAAATPGRLATAADVARTAEFGIKPTLGQATGDTTQLRREDLLHNAPPAGSSAGRTMDRAYGAQRDAVTQAKDDLIGGTTQSEEELGQHLVGGIRERANALETAEDKAWQPISDMSPFNATGKSVQYDPTASGDLWSRVAKTSLDTIGNVNPADPATRMLYPSTLTARNLIRDMITTQNAAGQSTITGFNIGQYNQVRRGLDAAYKAAANDTDALAVSRIRQALDDSVQAAEEGGQFTGDPKVLGQLQAARAATRAKYQFVAPTDNAPANAFMRKVLDPNLDMTGQSAVDSVIGSGPTPGKDGTMGIVGHLQNQFINPNDPVHNALEAATTSRILYGRGEPQIGNQRTMSQIDNATNGPGAAVTDAIVDADKQAKMQRLRDALGVLQRSSQPTGPRMNTSGTGYTTSDLSTLRVAQHLPVVRSQLQQLQAFLDARRALDVGASLSPLAQRPSAPVGLLAPVVGGQAIGSGITNQPPPGGYRAPL